MIMGRADYIWFNGEIVSWDEAKIHVRSACALRGANVYEGIRAYRNESRQQLYIFRMSDHMDRLHDSMKIMRMSIPYSRADLVAATIELLKRCNFREDVHIRPTAYLGEAELYACSSEDTFTGVHIGAVPLPSKLEDSKGVNCGVSSWVRISDNSVPPRVKAGANYQNSRLAAMEARVKGYDSAIMLDDRGKVTEGPRASLFIVRDGVPITPSVTSCILEGITRKTLIQLFRQELGLEVEEREVDRTELYVADEAFFCGTGWEIRPIVSVDRYQIGDGGTGQLTDSIRRIYANVVRGLDPRYARWLLPVY